MTKRTLSNLPYQHSRKQFNRAKKTLLRLYYDLTSNVTVYFDKKVGWQCCTVALHTIEQSASAILGALCYARLRRAGQVQNLLFAVEHLWVDSEKLLLHKYPTVMGPQENPVKVEDLPATQTLSFVFYQLVKENDYRAVYLLQDAVMGLLDLIKRTDSMYITVDDFYTIEDYEGWEKDRSFYLLHLGRCDKLSTRDWYDRELAKTFEK